MNTIKISNRDKIIFKGSVVWNKSLVVGGVWIWKSLLFEIKCDHALTAIEAKKVCEHSIKENNLAALTTVFSTCNFTSLVKATSVPYRKRRG